MSLFDSRDPSHYSDLYDELFPICRSITGPGIRTSMEILQRHIPLEFDGVASGTEVFDWTVPKEWSVEEARLTGPDGETVVDFRNSNLHVVNFSVPVDRELELEDLQPHLHSIETNPDVIPYVTSYYDENWGFCLTHRQREALKPGRYHARIVSKHTPGKLMFGHCALPGRSDRLVLLTSYLCHPSLANNELSGPLVLLGLYHRIKAWPSRRLSYRFVLTPETIGSLCYLYKFGESLKQQVDAGLVLTCLGGPSGSLSYKTSRRENSSFDRLVRHFQRYEPDAWHVRPFTPTSGSDERQYCSPGFNLPVGQMARTVYGDYSHYHTSGDDKEFMTIQAIVDSVDRLERMLKVHEAAGRFINLKPYGEPQLGRRGLYPNLNSPNTWAKSDDETVDGRTVLGRIQTILCYSDGDTDMLDIADRAGCKLDDLVPLITRLESEGLIEEKKQEWQ